MKKIKKLCTLSEKFIRLNLKVIDLLVVFTDIDSQRNKYCKTIKQISHPQYHVKHPCSGLLNVALHTLFSVNHNNSGS